MSVGNRPLYKHENLSLDLQQPAHVKSQVWSRTSITLECAGGVGGINKWMKLV